MGLPHIGSCRVSDLVLSAGQISTFQLLMLQQLQLSSWLCLPELLIDQTNALRDVFKNQPTSSPLTPTTTAATSTGKS